MAGKVSGHVRGNLVAGIVLFLALGIALTTPTVAEAGKPWKGHWSGSGDNDRGETAKFKVDFDITKKQTVVDVEVRNVSFYCESQGGVYNFPRIDFEQTARVGKQGRDNAFLILETFDSGFGPEFEYEVQISGEFNRDWTRVKPGNLELFGPLLGDCSPVLGWDGRQR